VRKTWLLCLVALAVCSLGWSAPSLQATRVGARLPVLDGEVLSDTAWTAAPAASGFTLLGKPGVAATQATEAKVLFDERNLYVAFVCREAQMDKVVSGVTTADGPVYNDDSVEVFLAPTADRTVYYHFVVNALGVVLDELRQDGKYNTGARAAAKKGKDLWSVELAIPLASLGINETTTSIWAVNFCREERPTGELSCWSPCSSGFHEPAAFGTLTGLSANFAPLMTASLRQRILAYTEELTQLQREARPYGSLEAGRIALGATDRRLSELEGMRNALSRRFDVVKAQELGRGLADVAQATAEIRARVARLPLVAKAGRTGYVVCQESTMVKVRPDKPYSANPAGQINVSLARNEYEAAQLVLIPLSDTLRKVTVTAGELTGPKRAKLAAENVDVRVVGYVEVKQKSGRAPMDPGLIPDPLLPNGPTDVDRTRVQSWWVTVHAPKDQPAGIYRGTIVVRPQNAPETKIPLQVRVWNFTLPTTSRLRSSYGINMAMVYNRYDIAPGPGQPTGWNAGAWVGADSQGRANYFGKMDYDLAFDYDVKYKGKRSCRIHIASIEKGTVESPRFAYHTNELDVKPNTDYEVSVWYRTAPGEKSAVSFYLGGAGAMGLPATEGQWKQGVYSFNSKDLTKLRVYLKTEAVGTVWFDNARLAPKGAGAEVNLLPNPDFEGGDETVRDRLQEAYYLNALEHRCSPTSLVAPKITIDADNRVSMDWTDFDAKMARYIAAGLSAFNVYWCRLPSGWGTVETVEDQKRIDQARQLLQQTQAHLEEKGWTHLAYIYTIDEPGAKAFPQVKQAFELAHSTAPKLKTLLTYGYGASKPIEPGAPKYADLSGYVDIHVPHSDCFEPIYLQKRQQAGDEIWAYVCISAQRPYLNCWGVDYPGLDHRLLFWQLFDHDITGFLYWQINYWKADPWTDTLTYPGGNGDGSLIYPAQDGPVDSLRWELCRDGTEDYDMLAMLRDTLAAAKAKGYRGNADAYLKFPQLTKSWTEYTGNPRLLEEQRRKVGNYLEQLTRIAER